MKILIGAKAPEFTLYNSEKEKISLLNFRGRKVLILFFPLAFTGTCTRELCNIRDNITLYNDLNTEVLGISVDSLYALARYKEDQHINFNLLSDFNKEVSASYGSLYEIFDFEMKGVGKRSAFVVDAEGMILYTEVLENAREIPDFNKIQHALRSLV